MSLGSVWTPGDPTATVVSTTPFSSPEAQQWPLTPLRPHAVLIPKYSLVKEERVIHRCLRHDGGVKKAKRRRMSGPALTSSSSPSRQANAAAS